MATSITSSVSLKRTSSRTYQQLFSQNWLENFSSNVFQLFAPSQASWMRKRGLVPIHPSPSCPAPSAKSTSGVIVRSARGVTKPCFNVLTVMPCGRYPSNCFENHGFTKSSARNVKRRQKRTYTSRTGLFRRLGLSGGTYSYMENNRMSTPSGKHREKITTKLRMCLVRDLYMLCGVKEVRQAR